MAGTSIVTVGDRNLATLGFSTREVLDSDHRTYFSKISRQNRG